MFTYRIGTIGPHAVCYDSQGRLEEIRDCGGQCYDGVYDSNPYADANDGWGNPYTSYNQCECQFITGYARYADNGILESIGSSCVIYDHRGLLEKICGEYVFFDDQNPPMLRSIGRHHVRYDYDMQKVISIEHSKNSIYIKKVPEEKQKQPETSAPSTKQSESKAEPIPEAISVVQKQDPISNPSYTRFEYIPPSWYSSGLYSPHEYKIPIMPPSSPLFNFSSGFAAEKSQFTANSIPESFSLDQKSEPISVPPLLDDDALPTSSSSSLFSSRSSPTFFSSLNSQPTDVEPFVHENLLHQSTISVEEIIETDKGVQYIPLQRIG